MTRTRWVCVVAPLAVLGLILGLRSSHSLHGQPVPAKTPAAKNAAERPYGIDQRVPWTTSNFRGSPEPPLPFRAEALFPKLNFREATVLTFAPGSDRFFVSEQGGKIYSLASDPGVAKKDPFLDVSDVINNRPDKDELTQPPRELHVYGLEFHPKFAENRFCYVCYVTGYRDNAKGEHPRGSRVSRFTVSRSDPPICDPKSEKAIIEWKEGGHNGGCLKFGPDGYLYISTGDGDGPFLPDVKDVGQDMSSLLSKIMRIDVEREQGGKAYTIPADNPFVSLEGARGEIWAYGFRNPWKMSFDRKTGDLWVGDVGWELWEMVYRVSKGDNCGWSIMEGPQEIKREGKRGPTEIVPPAVSIPHTDGASVTGGFVYRGKKFPELYGQYIFGDWETRRIWGVPVDGETLGERRDVVEPTVRLVDVGEDKDGELFLLDYDDGSISKLVRNDLQASQHVFPRKLSETGFFSATGQHKPNPGVVPFTVNAERWADGAHVERYVAIPGTASLKRYPNGKSNPGALLRKNFDFPKDGVLFETFSLETEPGKPASRRRVETQVLHFTGRDWRGYSYEWNDEQTDATLVPAEGKIRTIALADGGSGAKQQTWRYPSRTDCLRCHSMWPEFLLGFNIEQLNRDFNYGSVTDNQIRTLRHIGIMEDVAESGAATSATPPDELPRLVDPFDASQDLALRARSYLHSNCAHCHRHGGGGSGYVHLVYSLPMVDLRAINTRPAQGTFGVHDAKIIAPGDPFRSLVYLRMAKLGAGHMPHLGSSVIDERGLRLVHDWIHELPRRYDEELLIERLARLSGAPEQPGRGARRSNDRLAPSRANDRLPGSPEQRAAERAKAIESLLATPESAAMLAHAVNIGQVPRSAVDAIVAVSSASTDVAVRDLFEPFIPEEKRIKRLGDVVQAAELLKLAGSLERGKELFHKTNGIQCKTCHRIAGDGTELGPDLSQVGKKYDRAKILENILDPSKNVEPAFALWMIETNSGKVVSGLLVRKTDAEIVIKDQQNKEHRFATAEVEAAHPQQKSMMPDLLLKDFTAQQVADLLAYLESLK